MAMICVTHDPRDADDRQPPVVPGRPPGNAALR